MAIQQLIRIRQIPPRTEQRSTTGNVASRQRNFIPSSVFTLTITYKLAHVVVILLIVLISLLSVRRSKQGHVEMFESYVTSLLLRYGRRFIKNLPDLKLSLWGMFVVD